MQREKRHNQGRRGGSMENSMHEDSVLNEFGLVEGTVAVEDTDVDTLVDEAVLGLENLVLLTSELGESPLVGNSDVLATRELVAGTTERLADLSLVGVLGADGEDDLTNIDASNETSGLAEGTTHTSLETISSGARQHLVDTDDVEGVSANTEMERVLAGDLRHVLVHDDTGSFKSLRGDLLLLTRAQVNAEREVIDGGILATNIVDTDLGVRDTTAVSGLDVGLVLAIAVALRGTATHCGCRGVEVK